MTSAEALVARAALWRWGAQAFWYPESAFLSSLRDRAARHELEVASRASGDGRAMLQALEGVWQAVELDDVEELGLPEEHMYLFGRQVLVSPYESSYTQARGAERAGGLVEVGSFYAAFGFEVSSARPELADHISAECEFVAALLAKEAYALAQGWPDRASLTRSARQKFLHEYPARWIPAFAEHVSSCTRLAFFAAASAFLLAVLALEPADGATRAASRPAGAIEGAPTG